MGADEPRTQPRKRPRQARSAATVEALLEATRQLLRQRGYAAITTQQIAKRAGVGIASLYEYFPSKEALVGGVIDAHVARLTQLIAKGLERFTKRPSRTGIRRVVEAVFGLHAGDEALHAELLRCFPLVERSTPIAATRRRVAALIRDYLASRTGSLAADPELVAMVITHAVFGLLEGCVLTGAGWADNPRFLVEVEGLMTRYLLGGPGILAGEASLP